MTMDLNDFITEQDDLLDRLADIEERHNEVGIAFDDDEVILSPELFNGWVTDHRRMLDAIRNVKNAIDECPLPDLSTDPSGQWFNTIFTILDGIDDMLLGHLGAVQEATDEADEADDP